MEKTINVKGKVFVVNEPTADMVESFRVGDAVKVLVKKYDGYGSYPGIILGFDNFPELPTVVIGYLETGYNTADIKFLYLNEKTIESHICHANANDILLNKTSILEIMDRQIQTTKVSLEDLKRKKRVFLEQFNLWFLDVTGKKE